jgi:dUTP pyrophosphatase
MEPVKILNKSPYEFPTYGKVGNSGMDIRANIEEDVILGPLERKLIPTGLYMVLPPGIEAQVRPRSGLALKRGITVLNTPGTVDNNYRGEIGVILINLSNVNVTIQPGERIAQIVFMKPEILDAVEISEIDTNTERGDTGYGDSGRF